MELLLKHLRPPRLTRQTRQPSGRLTALPRTQRSRTGHLRLVTPREPALLADLAPALDSRIVARQRARRRVHLRLGRRRLDVLGAGLQGLEQRDDRLRRQVLVVVVVDLNHWRVDAGAQTFDLHVCEQLVGGCLAGVDAEVGVDGLDDGVGAAATELAGSLFHVSTFVPVGLPAAS